MAKNHSKLKKTRSTSERRVNTKQKLENGKVKENETKKINKNSKIENIREQGLIRITRNMAKVTSVVKFEEPLQNVTEKLSNLNKSKSKNVNKDQKIDQHLATPSSNVVTHAVERTLVKCDTKRITRTMAKGINTAKAENLIEKTDRNRTQSNCNANSLDEKRKSDKTANVKQKEKKQLVKHEIFLQNEICFAKMTGYRPWPAKVLQIFDDSPRVEVFFYGDNGRTGTVFKSKLIKFNEHLESISNLDACSLVFVKGIREATFERFRK